MSAPAEPAQIDNYSDEQPYQVDAFGRHTTVNLPGVHKRRERHENEAEHRQDPVAVEGALKVGRE